MRLTVSVILFLVTKTVVAQITSLDLHELYEPAPVLFRFETPGWFILAGILLLFSILVIIRQIRKFVKNRYRREALQKLAILDHAGEEFLHLFVILKQTAIHAFGRDQVGHLYGKEWLSFLEKTGKDVHLSDYHLQVMHAIYGGELIDGETQQAILLNAKKWVRTHAG